MCEFDETLVSINLIMDPGLRQVNTTEGERYQVEYIINYLDKRYVPVFELDEFNKLTGEGTVYSLDVSNDNFALMPILEQDEWELAESLFFFVEDNSRIIETQLERQTSLN